MQNNHLFLALSLLTPSLLLSALPAQSWTQLHGEGSKRTSTETVGLTKWPDDGPPEAWRISTELGFSSFVISEQRAFTLVSRDDEETLIAISTVDGDELWSAAVTEFNYDPGGGAGTRDNRGGDGPRSTPTIDNGMVYVYDSELGLSAFKCKTGKRVWSCDVQGKFKGRNIRWQNASSPLVDGNLVFVGGGGAGQSLLAFNKRTGKLAWKVGDELITHATPIATTIHGVRQIIFYLQSGIVALAPKTGAELWRQEYSYRTSTAASPVVFEDIVYISAGYGVGAGAFRIEKKGKKFTSKLIWRKRNKLINHWSTPVCHEGFLYGMFSFKKYGEGPLCCVDIRTGETKWSIPGFGPGNAIAIGDDLIALSDSGEVALIALDPEEYTERARAQVLEGKCWSSPSYADGKLYLRSTEEGVCLKLNSKD